MVQIKPIANDDLSRSVILGHFSQSVMDSAIADLYWIKSPCQSLPFVLGFAGIQQRVVQIKPIEKDDLSRPAILGHFSQIVMDSAIAASWKTPPPVEEEDQRRKLA